MEKKTEIELPVKQIDIEADVLINRIKDVKNDIGSIGMQIKPNAKVIRSTHIVFDLMQEIIEFVRRNHQ